MKTLKGFDQYVKEADREPIELPMPDGKPIIVHFPTLDKVKALARSGEDDFDAHIRILFGEKDADRLIKALGDAPADVLQNIILDVRAEFGVAPGNWVASPG